MQIHAGDEVTLLCGDTVTAHKDHETTEAYRLYCPHCERRDYVMRVERCHHQRVRHVSVEIDSTGRGLQPATTGEDAVISYASAFGYASAQLEYIRSACDSTLRQLPDNPSNLARQQLARVRDMADRGITEANQALRRSLETRSAQS